MIIDSDVERMLMHLAGAESRLLDQLAQRSRSESEETMTYIRPPGLRRSRAWLNSEEM